MFQLSTISGEPKNSGLPVKKKTPNATQLSYSSVFKIFHLQKLVKNGGTPWYPPNQTILVLKSHGLEFPQNPHPPASLSTALARMSPCRTSLRCTLTWWRKGGARAWNEGLENQRLFRISASILWGILRVYKLYQIMKYAHKNSENPQWIMSKYCTVGFRNDCSYIVDLALMIRCDCSCGHGSKAVCQTLALLQIDQKPWGCNLHSDNLWQIRKTYENLISQKPSNEPSRQDPQCSWFISWFLLARVGYSCHNYIDILIIYMNNSIILYIL